MKKLYFLICSIVMVITFVSGCNKIEEPTTENNNEVSMLYDKDFIRDKYTYQDLTKGYIHIEGDQVSFQQVIFDSDEKEILYVKEYIDKDFIKYNLSNESVG